MTKLMACLYPLYKNQFRQIFYPRRDKIQSCSDKEITDNLRKFEYPVLSQRASELRAICQLANRIQKYQFQIFKFWLLPLPVYRPDWISIPEFRFITGTQNGE
jgi:hypothetical protein